VCGDDLKCDLRLFEGDSGLAAGQDVKFTLTTLREETGVAAGQVVHANGSISVHLDDGVGSVKLLFDDADDGDVLAVKADRAADNFGIAAKAFLPVTIAEDDNVASAGLIALTGEDEAADDGTNAQHCEEVARDFGDDGTVGATVGPDADEVESEGGHVGEDGCLLVVQEIEIGSLVWFGGGAALHTDDDEVVGVFDRERAEEEDVGETEDRSVGADAERQGEYGDEGEAGALAEHANGEADVLPESLHCSASRVMNFLTWL